MSDTTAAPTAAGPSEPDTSLHHYVTRVRQSLADLPADDIEELTGGLEADLAERLADAPEVGDLLAELGPPERYAAELREAAGLPAPRPAATPARSSLPDPEDALRSWRTRATAAAPWLADLRPVWWVARGAAVGFVVGQVLGLGGGTPLLLAVIGAALSFWLGRHTRDAAVRSGRNRLALAANAAALLALVPVVLLLPFIAAPTAPDEPYVTSQPVGQDGVWVNGEPATNLYAYDAQGNRIDRVRLFNQYGQAVTVGFEPLLGAVETSDPLATEGILARANRAVFPLRWEQRTGWEPSAGGWEPPVQISPLAAEPSASQSGSPTASTGASTTAPPTATGAATPSARPGGPTATP